MIKFVRYLPFLNLFGLVVIISYLSITQQKVKSGFVVNKTIFEQFNGKKEMEAKLISVLGKDKKVVDSLAFLYENNLLDPPSELIYREKSNQVKMKEQEFSSQYSNRIWVQINQYIEEYGREHGYDYIHGAIGNGSLMFAKESNDITEELIIYMNEKYEGK